MITPKTGILGLTLLAMAQPNYADDDVHLIVKFKHQASAMSLQNQLAKITHLSPKSVKPMAGGAYTVTYEREALAKNQSIQGNATQWVLSALKASPEIKYAVKDRIGYFKPTPKMPKSEVLHDLSHELQWDEFKAPAGIFLESAADKQDGAWAYTRGQSNQPIVVAVLDTGIEENVSLVKNIVKGQDGKIFGWNFAANNSNVFDETESYHGTHVAGTIAAYGGVMEGIGSHLKILPVKIPDASGMFYESQVINGIYWSVGGEVPDVPTNPYPAKVLNMSFGVDEHPGKEIDHCDEALQEALYFVRQKGAVVAVAAGNDNEWEHYNAPGACNSVMRIAATGPKGLRSYFSNYGPSITFAAPGGDKRYGTKGGILSTVNPGGGYLGSGYDFYQGTSMASPHAAGVAALLYAVTYGEIKPEKLEQTLYVTTHAFGESSNDNDSCVGKKPCGHGILDANNAVKAALANYDLLFSAPKVDEVQKQCQQNTLKPLQQSLQNDVVLWKPLASHCNTAQMLKAPSVSQEDGKIIAHYGNMAFALDTASLKQCLVIGYDGVGCYR